MWRLFFCSIVISGASDFSKKAYISTKQNKVSKAAAGGENHRGSPKFQKNQQLQQSRPLGQHNGQNLNTKPKSIPSGQKQSSKHPLERQNSSPRPIPNKHPRNNNSNRSSPSSSNRSSPSSTRRSWRRPTRWDTSSLNP